MRKSKPGRVAKPCRSSVDDFGYESQRLKRARAEFFQKERRSKVRQVPLVSHQQNGSQAFQVDAVPAHFMLPVQRELADLLEVLFRILPQNIENSALSRRRLTVDKVHDL